MFRVTTSGGYPPADPDKGHEVDLPTLAEYFEADGSGSAYHSFFWLTFENGAISAIEEQYIS